MVKIEFEFPDKVIDSLNEIRLFDSKSYKIDNLWLIDNQEDFRQLVDYGIVKMNVDNNYWYLTETGKQLYNSIDRNAAIIEIKNFQIQNSIDFGFHPINADEIVNYENFSIDEEGRRLAKQFIVNVNKNKESVLFAINNGKMFGSSRDQEKGSIYWHHAMYGKCIRLKSSQKI